MYENKVNESFMAILKPKTVTPLKNVEQKKNKIQNNKILI